CTGGPRVPACLFLGLSCQLYYLLLSNCTAHFKRADRLEIHTRTHTGERPFVCDHAGCDRTYARRQHLERHKASHDEKHCRQSYPCQEPGCASVYATPQAMQKHMKSKHLHALYKCEHDKCGKQFKKHHSLKKHEYEHTGVLPFACAHEGCEKRFLLPSKLKQHEHVHLGITCTESGCGQVFYKWTLFRKHKSLAHKTTYACGDCSRRFTHRRQLRQHAVTHSSSREVYACPRDGCPRAYFDQRNLRQHLLSYHSGKRFPCEFAGCERTFAHKTVADRHVKTHDPNKPLPKKRKKKSMAVILSGINPPSKGGASVTNTPSTRVDNDRCETPPDQASPAYREVSPPGEEAPSSSSCRLTPVGGAAGRAESGRGDDEASPGSPLCDGGDDVTEQASVAAEVAMESPPLTECNGGVMTSYADLLPGMHAVHVGSFRVPRDDDDDDGSGGWFADTLGEQQLLPIDRQRLESLIVAGLERDGEAAAPPCGVDVEGLSSRDWQLAPSQL
ncbi:PREDICTED: transcription factor IIIA-like, partial [Priapulus caudatus]|uniref:Transcription factor IIIA-like n=1 Tax=Priapulus caudatus TaxID=37621 RepID=A0ABM1EJ95_PRICU